MKWALQADFICLFAYWIFTMSLNGSVFYINFVMFITPNEWMDEFSTIMRWNMRTALWICVRNNKVTRMHSAVTELNKTIVKSKGSAEIMNDVAAECAKHQRHHHIMSS